MRLPITGPVKLYQVWAEQTHVAAREHQPLSGYRLARLKGAVLVGVLLVQGSGQGAATAAMFFSRATLRRRARTEAERLVGLPFIGDDAFEIGTNHAPDSQRLCVPNDVVGPRLAGAPPHAQRFQRHIKTDGASKTKTVDD